MSTFDLARAYEHGACPECSRPGRIVWHYEGSRCPFRARERSVPCRGSSLYESRMGLHRTFNESGICDACLPKLAASQDRARGVAAASMPGATDRGSSAATPVPSSGSARVR